MNTNYNPRLFLPLFTVYHFSAHTNVFRATKFEKNALSRTRAYDLGIYFSPDEIHEDSSQMEN